MYVAKVELDHYRNIFSSASEYFRSIAISSASSTAHSAGQFFLHHYICF
jgi:hypothetical protein